MATPNHSELDVELGDLLQEFNDVVKELSTSHVNQHMFVKRPPGLTDTEDSDYSGETSLVNGSEEELNITSRTGAPTGMATDTSDLQSFIEKLDRDLTEM
ncbi:regulator of cell cycle RGCC-like isoform X3 [Triplophysa dalaica]|uniref:regulator of cell cycle RGCC-like isoform X3 n=1 Tax=Triplophysa dalaica TaxID=1582913 RepID=UPI0024DF8878|nr:regulator of cell cycle RGCC-like isoform X3 [Triplophysa dalaica]XP_056626288.1 regulator of cell cycle RGCC-like isoform X3 [Triplophysa dalaica]